MTTVGVRVDAATLRRWRAAAKRDGRTLSAWLRWVAEQALMAARRYRSPQDMAVTLKVLEQLDRLKSVARYQRLNGSGHGVEGPG